MSRRIHITVAMPLSDAAAKMVEEYLTDRYGEHTTEWRQDNTLLGGIVIFDGDKVFDGSLKSKLNRLKP